MNDYVPDISEFKWRLEIYNQLSDEQIEQTIISQFRKMSKAGKETFYGNAFLPFYYTEGEKGKIISLQKREGFRQT